MPVNGDLVLLYISKKQKGKLKLIGNGPYQIDYIYSTRDVMLEDLEGNPFLDFINKSWIKRYHCLVKEPPESVVPPH